MPIFDRVLNFATKIWYNVSYCAATVIYCVAIFVGQKLHKTQLREKKKPGKWGNEKQTKNQQQQNNREAAIVLLLKRAVV